MVEDRSFASRLFSVVNYFLLSVIGLLCLLPFLHVLAGSFTTNAELAAKPFIIIPEVWSLAAYEFVFSTNTIMRAMLVSICVTIAGTAWSMLLTSLTAYGLARKDLDGRRVFMFLVVFTMLFQGGMIPTFLIVKELGMINTYLALIIPSSISAFNMIILKNFFQNIPEGLEESAKIDGSNDFGILFRIVLPLSLPAMATISLFYAVTYWNTYLSAILYIDSAHMWPIQVWLRQVVVLASGLDGSTTEDVPPPDQAVKMAVIIVATIPIMLVYPFLQKHFAKGALLGSIKG